LSIPSGEVLTEYLDFRPGVADSILDKSHPSVQSAEAARARDWCGVSRCWSSLPGKLVVVPEISESEIYIVERGDSAGEVQNKDAIATKQFCPCAANLNIEKTDDAKIYKTLRSRR